MKPILLATDGSPSAGAATREAIDLARTLDTPLVVASVAHDAAPFYGGYYGYVDLAVDLREIERKHAAEVVAGVEELATQAGVTCSTITLEGVPGQAICQAAVNHGARLVVVGAHGWGRLGRLVHGSVSTHVLHHAPCPVLVVHGDPAPVTADDKAVAGTAS